MSDHNDYLLPEPCLRLDFGFGEQYQSIELGDGTGYLRLRGSEDRETELRERIASLNAENVDIDVENAKLRELVRDAWGNGHPDKSCGDCEIMDECHAEIEEAHKNGNGRWNTRCLFERRIEDRMRNLGVEVDQ